MDGSKNSKNSNITALLAEKLSSEMEEDQQATSRRLQSQKEEAAKRLKQVRISSIIFLRIWIGIRIKVWEVQCFF